jgi:hypothetical protein
MLCHTANGTGGLDLQLHHTTTLLDTCAMGLGAEGSQPAVDPLVELLDNPAAHSSDLFIDPDRAGAFFLDGESSALLGSSTRSSWDTFPTIHEHAELADMQAGPGLPLGDMHAVAAGDALFESSGSNAAVSAFFAALVSAAVPQPQQQQQLLQSSRCAGRACNLTQPGSALALFLPNFSPLHTHTPPHAAS